MSNVHPITPKRLPQFVGYSDVQQSLGLSRRTVERMVREGKFPKPIQLSDNRVGWDVEVVRAWLDERGKGLAARAVNDPNDLDVDELLQATRDLIVEALSRREGKPVDPASVASLTVSRTVSEDEFRHLEAQEFAVYAERFKSIDLSRSLFLAAWLFPELRPCLSTECDVTTRALQDPAALAWLGPLALHDDTWFESEDDLVEAQARADH